LQCVAAYRALQVCCSWLDMSQHALAHEVFSSVLLVCCNKLQWFADVL